MIRHLHRTVIDFFHFTIMLMISRCLTKKKENTLKNRKMNLFFFSCLSFVSMISSRSYITTSFYFQICFFSVFNIFVCLHTVFGFQFLLFILYEIMLLKHYSFIVKITLSCFSSCFFLKTVFFFAIYFIPFLL